MIEKFKFFRKETVKSQVQCFAFKPGFSPSQTNLNPPKNAMSLPKVFTWGLMKRFAAEYAFFVNTC